MKGMSIAVFTPRSLLSEGVTCLLVGAGAIVTTFVCDDPAALQQLAVLRPQLILVDCQARRGPSCEQILQASPGSVVVGLSLLEPILEVCPGERVPAPGGAEFLARVAELAHASTADVPLASAADRPTEVVE